MREGEVDICVFGAFDPAYARNHVLRTGLRRLGHRVELCLGPAWRWTLPRYMRLTAAYLGRKRAPVLLVPEFRHKDVPLARLLSTLAGATLVVDPLISRFDTRVHDWKSHPAGSWGAEHAQRVDRAAVRFADLLLCDTQAHAHFFQHFYRVPRERCTVVPVGFDDAVFRPLPEPSVLPFRAAFFGSYLPLHGVDTIVEAARRLRHRNIRFLLVGSGQTFEVVRRAQEEGLGLEVCGALPAIDLVQRLQSAHVLLGVFGTTPKAGRVVPNKVFQSLALGRAVVTADSAAIREFFTPGEHLCVVPPGDADALAQTLLALRDNPAWRRQLARSGARHVHAHFAPQNIAARFVKALSQIGVPA